MTSLLIIRNFATLSSYLYFLFNEHLYSIGDRKDMENTVKLYGTILFSSPAEK